MPDCGDNSCLYAKQRGGMRTNGGCRCDNCPTCGAPIRPLGRGGEMRRHYEWCPQPEWVPEHHADRDLLKRATTLLEWSCGPGCSHEGCGRRDDKFREQTGTDYWTAREQLLAAIEARLKETRREAP